MAWGCGQHHFTSTVLPLPNTLTLARLIPDLTRTWFPAEPTDIESVYSLPLIVTLYCWSFDCCSFFGWQPASSRQRNRRFFISILFLTKLQAGGTSSYAAILIGVLRLNPTLGWVGESWCRRGWWRWWRWGSNPKAAWLLIPGKRCSRLRFFCTVNPLCIADISHWNHAGSEKGSHSQRESLGVENFIYSANHLSAW